MIEERISDGDNESIHSRHNNLDVRGRHGFDADRGPTAIHEAEAMGLLPRRRGNHSKNTAACLLNSLVNFDQSPSPLPFNTQKSQIISLSDQPSWSETSAGVRSGPRASLRRLFSPRLGTNVSPKHSVSRQNITGR